MTNDELYNSLSKRFSTYYFKQNNIPSKDLINTILEESLKITPIFSNIWHHKVDVYGPEYAEDKRKVCIQTVEHLKSRKKYNSRERGEPGIEVLHKDLEEFEEAVKTGKVRKEGFRPNSEKIDITFNTQVMAPYLLKFTFDKNVFGKIKPKESLKGQKLKGWQGAMAQAYAIAIIANKYKVDSSFCGCFIFNDYNINKIWYNDDNIIKFVGLGYRDENCYESPGSNNHLYKKRPNLNDNVIRWN